MNIDTTPEATPQEQDDPTPSLMSSGTDALPLHLLSEPLHGQIDWVQRRYGLDPVTACLTTLVSVVCACGPGHRILNPLDDSFLPATLGFIFHGDAMHLGVAINLSLDPLRRWLLARIGQPDKRELRRTRLRLADLHRERGQLEAELGRPDPEPTLSPFGAMDPKEAAKLREQTRARLETILGEIEATTFLLLPHVLADDATTEQLLAPGRLALDGAVLATSLGGDAVRTWSSATGPQKAALARLLNLSWRGWPQAGDEQTHARPLLSTALVTDPGGSATLWQDKGLAGVNRHLFFVGHDAEPVFDLDARPGEEVPDFCNSALHPLIEARLEGRGMNHLLNHAATAHFQTFLNEKLAAARTLPADESHRAERAPVLALKLALLIHVVSPARDDETIDVPTVEFACRLADSVCTRDLDFVRSQVVLPTTSIPTRDTDEDVQLENLVRKLRLRGPLPWRKLQTSFHKQKAGPLEALLERGITAGRIRKEDGLFAAMEAAS